MRLAVHIAPRIWSKQRPKITKRLLCYGIILLNVNFDREMPFFTHFSLLKNAIYVIMVCIRKSPSISGLKIFRLALVIYNLRHIIRRFIDVSI